MSRIDLTPCSAVNVGHAAAGTVIKVNVYFATQNPNRRTGTVDLTDSAGNVVYTFTNNDLTQPNGRPWKGPWKPGNGIFLHYKDDHKQERAFNYTVD